MDGSRHVVRARLVLDIDPISMESMVDEPSAHDIATRLADGLNATIILDHPDQSLVAFLGPVNADDVDVSVRVDGADADDDGRADGCHVPDEDCGAADARNSTGDGQIDFAPPAGRRAVLSLISTSPQAEGLFRSVVVAIDAIPGNQVEGISALYHVSAVDGPDSMTTLLSLSTCLSARGLSSAVHAIISDMEDCDVRIIDMLTTSGDADDIHDIVADESVRSSAAVLVPWSDMEPDAVVDGDPVSYRAAMAPDAENVGMLADDWVFRGAAADSEGIV
ncbi:hypothetical protein [uncultured Bifidobacterium sp.]|uniref:hypothetical protein n=1 Tax=uncultured Bifidobacterium sp. TaxID=165187 RepID=UPI00260E9C72|nr:hypothetical protein [uncultured Bifidobacterium sp.]